MRFKRSEIRRCGAGDAALKSTARPQAHVKNNPWFARPISTVSSVSDSTDSAKKSGAAARRAAA
jgi:hypothetical protein